MNRFYLLITIFLLIFQVKGFSQCSTIPCDSVSTFNYTALGINSFNISWTPPAVLPDTGYQVIYRRQNIPNDPWTTLTKYKHPWINEVRYHANAAPEGFEIVSPRNFKLDCYEAWIFEPADLVTPSIIMPLSGSLLGSGTDFFFGAQWQTIQLSDSGAIAWFIKRTVVIVIVLLKLRIISDLETAHQRSQVSIT